MTGASPGPCGDCPPVPPPGVAAALGPGAGALPASPAGAVGAVVVGGGVVDVGGGAAVVEVGGLPEVGGSVWASALPVEKTNARTAMTVRIEIRRDCRPLP